MADKKREYTKEHPFVRSIYNLGDYQDSEHNTLPSLTDPSQDEPIEKLVQRLLKGEVLGGSSPVFDDIRPETPVADVFASQDVTTRDGFDMADSGPIVAAGVAAAAALKSKDKTAAKGDANGNPPVVTPPAEVNPAPKA